MARHLILSFAFAGLLFQAVASTQQKAPAAAPAYRVVAKALAGPWEIQIGPDKQLWVTERLAGRVTRINPADGSAKPLIKIDEVYPGTSWHEGLLGMVLQGDSVYLAYTYDADPGKALARRLKVRRYTYNASTATLSNPVDITSNLPANADHGGGRLIIGPDQKLYLSRGDGGANWLQNYCMPNAAQDLPAASAIQAKDWSTYAGKILRLNL